MLGKHRKGKGRGTGNILSLGILYSIALHLCVWSIKGLLVTILLSSTVEVIILEERVDTFLVHAREAQLLLYCHGEPELRSTLGAGRMMRKGQKRSEGAPTA